MRSQDLPKREVFRGLQVRRIAGLRELRTLISEGFDVVHAHMPRRVLTLSALFAAKQRGLPTVLTPHCFYPSRKWFWRGLKAVYDATLLRYTFGLADRVINLTEQDRDDAVARGLRVGKSCVIPNSVRVSDLASVGGADFRAQYDLPWEFLLFIGRFDWVKNVEFLVHAQRHLPRTLGLVLIGQDGGRLGSVRRLIYELGVSDRVRIIERAQFRDLCGAYQQARALVLASLYEGLPTVILEAMYFGCPVVASRTGGVPYVLREEAPGLTYPLGDEGAYIRAVNETLFAGRDVEKRGRKLVEREYAWEVNAAGVLSLYQELHAAHSAAVA